MKLKGEMSMLNVLHLQDNDVEKICAELQKKRDEAPQFFMQSPIVVDCSELGEGADSFDFSALRKNLLSLGFIPVGIRNIPESKVATVSETGWAVMRGVTRPETKQEIKAEPKAQAQPQTNEVAPGEEGVTKQTVAAEVADISSLTIDHPVRSGQQIYAAGADMTVLAPTSAGSEVMADGSIHVYGPLRGRVLAGARGNESARIFCQSLQAELIAIAGRYQLLDEVDTGLIGKPAMIRLDGEKLIIESLA